MNRTLLCRFLLLLCCLYFPYTGNAQTVSVFDVDASKFPQMTAKLIVADKNEEAIRNFNAGDIEIIENGRKASNVIVNCPPLTDKTCVKVVLVIDQSLSMEAPIPPTYTATRLEAVQQGAITFLQTLSFKPPTVVALTSFDKFAYTALGFQGNNIQLLNEVQKISTNSDPNFIGTNYEAALNDPFSGALPLLKNQSDQCPRVIVFLTDGSPVPAFDRAMSAPILQELKNENIQLYAISIGSNYIDPELEMVAIGSGGKTFVKDNPSEEELKAIYKQIAEQIQGVEPCTITWDSFLGCGDESVNRTVDVRYTPLSAKLTIKYTAPDESVAKLKQSAFVLAFGNPAVNQSATKQIKITATNSPFDIQGAVFTPPNPYFSVSDWGGLPPPFTLAKDEERTITVTFTQQVSLGYRSARLLLTSTPCPIEPIVVWGGAPPAEESPIRLFSPNGDRSISACDSVDIVWGGVPPYMPVRLSYSLDSGKTWMVIKDRVTGQKYRWKPNQASDKCLVKVESLEDFVDWKWVKQEGFIGQDRAVGVGVDGAGDAFVAGDFSGTVRIDTFELKDGGTFLARYTPEGKIVWATKIVSGVLDIAVTPAGESVVMGRKFLMRYKPDGTAQWSGPVAYPIFPRDTLQDIAIDGAGSCWAGGTTTTPIGVSSNKYALFVDKYGAAGARQIPRITRDNAQLYCLAADLAGNVVVSGFFSGGAGDTFGGEPLSSGYFIAKFNSVGQQLWVKNTDEIYPMALATDGDGNIYQTGWFSGTRSFGSIKETSSGSQDAFLAKYNGDGTVQWVRSGGVSPSSFDYGIDVSTDIHNNCYVTGLYQKLAAENGDFHFSTESVVPRGRSDVFLAKFAPNGTIEWLSDAGGVQMDTVAGIAVDRNGRSYLAGAFTSTASFGVQSVQSYGETDAFVACIGTIPAGADVSDTVFAVQAPVLITKTNPFDMGAIAKGQPKAANFTQVLCNTGTYPLHIVTARIAGGDDTDFQLISVLDNVVLQPNECKTIELVFTPSAVGERASQLVITADCVPTMSIDIIGKGNFPCELRHEALLDAGTVDVGVGTPRTFTDVLCNDGSEPISFTVRLFGPGKDAFTLLSPVSVVLNNGECYELRVEFKPTTSGTAEATYVSYTSQCGSLEAELTGKAAPVPPSIQAVPMALGMLPCPGDVRDTFLLVENLGKTNLVIYNVTLQDGNKGFSVVSWPSIVGPQKQDTIFLRFAPSTPGSWVDNVVVNSNASNDQAYQISVNGRLSNVQLNVPPPVVFGIVAPSEFPVRKTITITNTSDITITITGASFGIGAPFTVVGDVPVELSPTSSASFEVEFVNPIVNGVYNDVLTVLTEPACTTYPISISGERSAAEAVLSIPELVADPHDRNYRIPVKLLTGESFPVLSRGRTFRIALTYNDRLFLARTVSSGRIVRVDSLSNERRIRVEIEGVTPESGAILTELIGDVLLGDTVETPIALEIVDWEDVVGGVAGDGKLRLKNITDSDGIIRLIRDRGKGPGIEAVVPNPSDVRATAIVRTVEIGEHSLDVYDASGRRVYHYQWEETASGLEKLPHKVEIPSAQLAVGAYRLLVRTPSTTAEGSMVIIR